MSTKEVCASCGVTTVTSAEHRLIGGSVHRVPVKRDYTPVTFEIHLKHGTKTTYIVTPELERELKTMPFSRIRSIGSDAYRYTIDVPLPQDSTISNLLSADGRIEHWHTEESAPVCDRHVNFTQRKSQ